MKDKTIFIRELKDKAEIRVSPKVKEIHPVVKDIIRNLAALDFIHFIRMTPDYIRASNELPEGRFKIPVTEPHHPTAVGTYLLVDCVYKHVQFYEITSAIKGCGGKMVDAVLKALPHDWKGIVLMDWSDGFWDNMIKRHKNLYKF